MLLKSNKSNKTEKKTKRANEKNAKKCKMNAGNGVGEGRREESGRGGGGGLLSECVQRQRQRQPANVLSLILFSLRFVKLEK